MKKIILAVVFMIGICTTASAQKELLLSYDVTLEHFAGQFWIDRSAQKFYFDSDSENTVDKAKEGVKNLFNKGKDLIKKKK